MSCMNLFIILFNLFFVMGCFTVHYSKFIHLI